MPTLSITRQNASALATFDGLTPTEAHEVAGRIAAAKSANTVRTYATQWRKFVAWCDQSGKAALPASPGSVALYLGRIASTNTRYIARAAIKRAHAIAGQTDPTVDAGVTEASKGAARQAADAGHRVRKARPLTHDDVAAIVAHLDATPDANSQRDAVMIACGYWSACRRSELVAWRCEDIAFAKDGSATVLIARSKTDQHASGKRIALPREAAHRLRMFTTGRNGFVFVGHPATGNRYRKVGEAYPLDGRDVARILKTRAQAAGIADAAQFSGHSLRRGFVTDAVAAGAALSDIAEHTRHASIDTLRGYSDAGSASVKRVFAAMSASAPA